MTKYKCGTCKDEKRIDVDIGWLVPEYESRTCPDCSGGPRIVASSGGLPTIARAADSPRGAKKTKLVLRGPKKDA